MSTFDDANVDKDLLSQIFADEGDDTDADALLDEMLKDVETEEPVMPELTDEPETPAEPDIPAEPEAAKEAVTSAAPAPAEPELTPATSPVVFETNTENDPVRREAQEMMEKNRESGEVTTITRGTTIRGSITSDSPLEVMGTITGDIDCQGMVLINGSASGNISASEIYVSTQRLEGNLSSEGAVKVGVGTVIFGDVSGTSACIAGAVKGDVDVNGHVEVDSTAIVQGNIKAKSIQIDNGAVVDGYCSLNYAGMDLDGFFNK